MTIRLSDAQRSLLIPAGTREDRCIYPVVAALKGGAVGNVCRSLLRRRLIEEAPAGNDQTVWRCDDDGAALTLRLTDAGLAAVQTAPLEEPLAEFTRSAFGEKQSGPHKSNRRSTPRGPKQAALVALLRRPEGATIADLQAATGSQPHSVPGVLSGTLGKKLRHEVTSEKEEGRGRVYRIVS